MFENSVRSSAKGFGDLTSHVNKGEKNTESHHLYRRKATLIFLVLVAQKRRHFYLKTRQRGDSKPAMNTWQKTI